MGSLIVQRRGKWIVIISPDTFARILIKDALDSNLKGLLEKLGDEINK